MKSGDEYMKGVRPKSEPLGKRGRPQFRVNGQHAHPGEGIRYELDGDDLVLRINLKQRLGKSPSGKSMRIAHSGGPVSLCTLPEMAAEKWMLFEENVVMTMSIYSEINPKKTDQWTG